VNKSDTDLG